MKRSYRDTFMQRMQANASRDYRNASGYSQGMYGQNNYGYGYANEGAEGKIGNFERTFTFDIQTINTTNPGTVTLFGPIVDETEATNTANNVLVTVLESNLTHPKIKKSIYNGPFRIAFAQMRVLAATQFSNVITLNTEGIGGETSTKSYQPQVRKSAKDQDSLTADLTDFRTPVYDWVYVNFRVNAGERVIFTCFISDIVRPSRVLSGENVREVNRAGYPGFASDAMILRMGGY